MKSEIIKSRLDHVKYIFAIALSLLLILFNLVGVSEMIFSTSDMLNSPIMKNIRNFGISTNILFTEITRKSQVLEENLKLKTEISELENIKVENEILKRRLVEREEKSSIQSPNEKKYTELSVRGVQNLYGPAPEVYLSLDSLNIYKIGQIVYHNKNQLFGIITEISGLTAKVIPFFSAELGFRIPVQSLKSPEFTGFIQPINDGEIRITNVNREANVAVGDLWTTTNDREDIPGDLVVGKIKSILEDKESGFKILVLENPFDVLYLETLLIVPNE